MIVVGGENLIDLVQTGGTAARPEFQAIPGGSQYNCALALGRLGLRPHYITPISTDAMGELLASTLIGSDVVVNAPRVSNPSSLAVVTINEGQPRYQFYRDGTAERMVTPTSLRQAIPTNIDLFQLGSLSLCDGIDADAWADLFVELAGRGVGCSLDPNVRPTLIRNREEYTLRLERMIRAASLVKMSDEDIEWLYPGAFIETRAVELAKSSKADLFVLTKGEQGAMLISRSRTVHIEAVQVTELQDTVGAGDTFMAALNYQMLLKPDLDSEADLRRIGDFAARAASINCSRTGCNPPYLNEIKP